MKMSHLGTLGPAGSGQTEAAKEVGGTGAGGEAGVWTAWVGTVAGMLALLLHLTAFCQACLRIVG